MKKSIAVAAVAVAVMTAGTGTATAFAAGTGHTAQVKAAETSTISKFVWGPYLIIVRYVKDDPLPKRFSMPMTLRAGEQMGATSGQLTTLQRSYESLARGSIQVFMRKQTDSKADTHAQRRRLHAHVNTGFGGEARQVAHHVPYSPGAARH